MEMPAQTRPFVEVLMPNNIGNMLACKLNNLVKYAEFCSKPLEVDEWRSLASQNEIVLAKVSNTSCETLVGIGMMAACVTGYGSRGIVTNVFVDGYYKQGVESDLLGALFKTAKVRGFVSIEIKASTRGLRAACREDFHMNEYQSPICFFFRAP